MHVDGKASISHTGHPLSCFAWSLVPAASVAMRQVQLPTPPCILTAPTVAGAVRPRQTYQRQAMHAHMQALARLTQTVTALRSCDRTQMVQILPVCTIPACWHDSTQQQRSFETSASPPYSREAVVTVPSACRAQLQLPTAIWHGLHTLPPAAASHDDPGQCCDKHDHHHHHHPSSQAKPATATAAAAGR